MRGRADVTVSVALTGASAGVRLASGGGNHVVRARVPVQIQLELPAMTASADIGTLVVEEKEVSRPAGADPWEPLASLSTALRIHVEVAAPASVAASQDLLYFRSGTLERSVTLTNTGGTEAAIVEVSAPHGYEIDHGIGVQLGAHERRTWTVRANPASNPAQKGELRFLLGDGSEIPIRLRYEPQTIRVLNDVVVGIDFGTTNTTIAFRECRHHPLLQDDVRFLHEPGQTEDRFRTLIWVSATDDTYAIGAEAMRRYERLGPSAGHLFMEVKSLLRDPSNPSVRPLGRSAQALNLVRERLGEFWHQVLVTRYLRSLRESVIDPAIERSLGEAGGTVRYVFSEPVLDYQMDASDDNAPIYGRHHAAMMECVKAAGFPLGQVEFQFEPVCASLALLYPPPESNWPRLGSRQYPITTGNKIAVFDSGGGTTDIVLMEAAVGAGGEVSLSVLSCLGVGTGAETFGGERITSDLLLVAGLISRKPQNTQNDVWLTALRQLSASVADDAELRRLARGSRLNTDDILGGLGAWLKGTLSIEQMLGERPVSRAKAASVLIDGDRDTAENLKLALSMSPEKRVAVKKGGSVISAPLVAKVASPYLNSLDGPLADTVFRGAQDEVRYYLPVGGNSRSYPVANWIREKMNDQAGVATERHLDTGDDERDVAIAFGAAWVPQARLLNAIPYGLELHADNNQIVRIDANSPHDAFTRGWSAELPAGKRMEITLFAQVADGTFAVARAVVENPSVVELASVRLRVDLDAGELKIRTGVSHAGKPELADIPLLTYRI